VKAAKNECRNGSAVVGNALNQSFPRHLLCYVPRYST